MTVNPNPLCRAQWLFSTSCFLFFSGWAQTSPAMAPLLCHGYLLPLLLLHGHDHHGQYSLHPGEACPCQHGFLAANLLSIRNTQPKVQPKEYHHPEQEGKNNKGVSVIWEHTTFCVGLIWGWVAVSPSVTTVGISSAVFQPEQVFVGQKRICLAPSVEIFVLAEGLGGENQMVPWI